ncbi:MAG: GGDEF domain-containing protein [Anaerolineales bacterium]
MLERLRAVSFEHLNPELRTYRIWITQRVTIVILVLLGAWALVDLTLWTIGLQRQSTNLVFDLASILFLFFSIWITRRMANSGNTIVAGHVSAASFLLLAVMNLLFYPRSIFIFSALLFVPIMLSGLIAGGKATFAYSFLASGALLVSGLFASALDPTLDFSTESWVLFLSTQVGLHQGLAALLFNQSRHLELTFQRLQTKTEELSQLAHTDPLTNLANRRFLIEQLEREFARAKRYRRPLSLLYLDLDGFKSVNDRFGHLFGDELLRTAALSMRAVLRSTDLLARIGGDEFAVLLPETTVKGAYGVALKLRRALDASSAGLGENVPSLTFSAGVSQMRFEDETVDDLLARADQVQYQAKAEGKGQIRSQQDISQLPLFKPEGRPERSS